MRTSVASAFVQRVKRTKAGKGGKVLALRGLLHRCHEGEWRRSFIIPEEKESSREDGLQGIKRLPHPKHTRGIPKATVRRSKRERDFTFFLGGWT